MTFKKTKKTELAQIDETGNRKGADRRKEQVSVAADRRKVQRRRQIDPTTCERDYSEEEIAFMRAMDDYKRRSGRMFPTCSEILEVVRELGYRRMDLMEEASAAAESAQQRVATAETLLNEASAM